MGARPMSRLIQDTIRKALADELLFGKLVNGGDVHIDIDENENIKLQIESKQLTSSKKIYQWFNRMLLSNEFEHIMMKSKIS